MHQREEFRACSAAAQLTVGSHWQGRLIVFQAREGKLLVLCEREVRGATYCLNAFQVSARSSQL